MAFIGIQTGTFWQLYLFGYLLATAWDLLRCMLLRIFIMLTWPLLAQDGALGEVLRGRYHILAQLVVQWRELIHFVEADLTVEHAEWVVGIGLACCCKLLLFKVVHISVWSFFQTVICQVLQLGLMVDQILEFALRQLWCGMGTVWLNRITRAHIEEALLKLAHFIRSLVHILTVLQHVVERLFLFIWKKWRVKWLQAPIGSNRRILAKGHRAEFCQIIRSFFGQWSFKKNCFWDLLTFSSYLMT